MSGALSSVLALMSLSALAQTDLYNENPSYNLTGNVETGYNGNVGNNFQVLASGVSVTRRSISITIQSSRNIFRRLPKIRIPMCLSLRSVMWPKREAWPRSPKTPVSAGRVCTIPWSAGAHPRFETINSVLHALGVKFAVVAEHGG